ncbi:MAG: 4'-phosphopantetheinyl transferase superfamily protein [Bacteroidota bacterium]|nr:4'-phosphopantetheinyl transferase superfamily protein [Bacteroidota bacterium]
MPLFKTISIQNGLIGIWELVETSVDLLPGFSPEELADRSFQQYTHEKRKVEWLATRALINQLIGSEFTISYLGTGQPILNHRRYKHLSISHSRYFVAVILHEHLNVGIDIEDMTRNYNPIEKRYLSADELIQVAQNPLLQCLYWCAKESVFKLVPEEGVEFRQQIHVSPFNPELENHFSVRFTAERKESIYQLHFRSFADHCIVWVTDNL